MRSLFDFLTTNATHYCRPDPTAHATQHANVINTGAHSGTPLFILAVAAFGLSRRNVLDGHLSGWDVILNALVNKLRSDSHHITT